MEYIEYGKDFTLFIEDNNKVKIEVVRMEDSSDDKPEVLTIRWSKNIGDNIVKNGELYV